MTQSAGGKIDTGESPTARAEFKQFFERTGWIFRREESNPQVLYPLRHSLLSLLTNKNNLTTFGVKPNEHNDIRVNKSRRSECAFVSRQKGAYFLPRPGA